MAQDERTLNMDLPDAVATAAREGNAEAVREWLAAGGAPDAIRENGRLPLLNHACMSSRPSCASIVEILVRRAPATWEAAGLVREAV